MSRARIAPRRVTDVAARSDTGLVRERNEDRWLVRAYPGTTLLAVADGVGGEDGGDIASTAAIEALASSRGGEDNVTVVVYAAGRQVPRALIGTLILALLLVVAVAGTVGALLTTPVPAVAPSPSPSATASATPSPSPSPTESPTPT